MQWRKALAAGAFAALPLFAQELVRLPAPSIQKDTTAVDSASRAQADTSGDTVGYSAVRIRFHGDHFSLSDKAQLKYKGSTLRADSIVYFSGDDMVEAMGAPLIEDPANPPILGYRMRYNLKNRVGTIYYGSSKRDKQYFNGTEIRRQPEGDVYIARGEFSTCDKLEPDYFFYARRMIVEPNAKVLSGPVVMNIAEVPVAILPMAVVPLGKGRRSGLVQPKIGGDQAQGFYLQNLGYYWAISEYMDLLTTGDVYEGSSGTFDNTDLNVKYQWNNRYVWSGSINNQTIIPQFDAGRAGDILDFTNDLNITPDGRQTLKGNGRLQSDPKTASENALTTQQAIQAQSANAYLGYRRQFDWNLATLNVDASQNYNLTQDRLDRSLPNIAFQAGGPLIPAPEDQTPGAEDPWYRKLRWDYGNVFNVDQVSYPSLTGSRGDTNVYVGYSDHLSFSGQYPAGYFNLSPSVNLLQLWSLSRRTGDSTMPYRTDFDPSSGHTGEYFFGWNTGIRADTRLYATRQADRPWFGRISALRHTVTPVVSLTYAPELDSNPDYYPNPKIVGTAYQAEQRTVGFQLGNDIDLKLADRENPKKKPESYKLLAANSSLDYNFANHEQPWSLLSSNFSLYATRNIAVTLSTTHELYDDMADTSRKNQVTSPILKTWQVAWRKGIALDGSFSTGARWRDVQGMPGDRFEQSPWSVALNYGFAFNGVRVNSSGGNAGQRFFGPAAFWAPSETYQVSKTHQASGSLHLNPTAEWKMSYDTEFNFTEGRFSSHVFGFERTLHCWQMEFHWTPVGVGEGWNFQIRIIDLPDIKLQTSDTRVQRGS